MVTNNINVVEMSAEPPPLGLGLVSVLLLLSGLVLLLLLLLLSSGLVLSLLLQLARTSSLPSRPVSKI